MKISIFGLGTVGSGVYSILKKKFFTFSKNNRFNLILKNNFSNYTFLFKKKNLFIETIGNIKLTIELILNCIKFNNNYITANKDLISKYFFFINFLFKKKNKKALFEAAVCGAMPILNNMKNFYSVENIYYLIGIINGTCNFILSKINEINFKKLIKLSIKKGYSEYNYENDIFGLDNIYKITILLSFINKIYLSSLVVMLESIFGLNFFLKNFFFEKKYLSFFLKIKKYYILCVSLFLTKNILFKKTKKSLNSIFINSKNTKKNFFLSLGAGKTTTAFSIISNYYQLFNKKNFLNVNCSKCFLIIKKNNFCFNFILKINFNYNNLFLLYLLKIFFIKFHFNNFLLIKTKKIFYKKILFFLYFIKNEKFSCYKFL